MRAENVEAPATQSVDLNAFIYAQSLPMLSYNPETGTFPSANVAAEQLFGLREAEIQKSRPAHLFCNGRRLFGDLFECENDTENSNDPCRRAVQLARRADERFVDLYIAPSSQSGTPTRLITLIDVTDQVEHERHLQQELSRLSQMYTQSPDAAVELDLNDRILSANNAFVELFGYEESELVGRRLEEIIVPEEERRESTALSLQALQEGNVAVEAVRISRNGESISCAITGHPIHVNGEVVGLYAVYKDIRHFVAEREALTQVIHEDELTGVQNRRGFESQCRLAVESDREYVLLFIDLDNFKPINDTHGHLVGDQVLKETAACLQKTLRSTDVVGRLGGDEFGILLEDCDLSDAVTVAGKILVNIEKLSKNIHSSLNLDSPLQFGASIGLAGRKPHYRTYERWLDAADTACYTAKESGKNAFAVVD